MRQVFRSKFAFVLGWVWVAFVAANTVDLIVRYSGKPSMVAGAVLGVLTAMVYVIALRPATVVEEAALTVRNPFRTTVLPWASVGDVTVSHAITVGYGEGEQSVRLWTPTATARERAKAQGRGMATPRQGRFRTQPALTKAEQSAQQAFAGKTHADWVGDQITERAETARRRKEEAGPATITWAVDSLVVIGVCLALVVAAILVP
ncbi:PH domain-containing protein [Nonomuraea typhae]|uniref:PH domain-containing protein n=1 Tax=Nonomuraea typhae TaxID=2603600 RepID=UPI0012FA5D97|nr:PH domain-containing protein [Nonomuraea typhae]